MNCIADVGRFDSSMRLPYLIFLLTLSDLQFIYKVI